MASPDFVIVDPCIRATAGHYAAYATACRRALADAGHATTCWAHRDVDPSIAEALDARRVFIHDCWHRYNTMPKVQFLLDPPLAARAFLRDASAARRAVGGRAVLFAPTVDVRQLLAWAWWLQRADRPERVVLMLRYSVAHPERAGWTRSAAWVRLALRLLGRAGDRAVRLVSDSARLSEEYRALGAKQVDVLPIPHTTVVRRRSQGATTSVRFVMLGDARTEKGFAVLVDAIEHLRGDARVPDVEFVVQANIQSPVYAALEPARERLRRLPGVTLVERALSPADYDGLLASADVVLLPYDRGVYRARTSGPFAEALAAGIPVVCTADTWMSDQLETYGAGELCQSGDAASLADAIERARRRLAELSERALARRAAWVAFHSPASFARRMVELVA